MRAFFIEHPYLRIFLIVLVYMTILFTWGKVFRDVEWYLDTVNVWIAGILSLVGLAFSALLLYFRYSSKPATSGAGAGVSALGKTHGDDRYNLPSPADYSDRS